MLGGGGCEGQDRQLSETETEKQKGTVAVKTREKDTERERHNKTNCEGRDILRETKPRQKEQRHTEPDTHTLHRERITERNQCTERE